MRFMKPMAVTMGLALGLIASAWSAPAAPIPADSAQAQQILTATSSFWTQQFAKLGGHYQPPLLTAFKAQIVGACSQKGPMSGSFYCPADQHLYVEENSMESLGARSQVYSVAEGFVIAHLVAHHVQFLIGTTAIVQQARSTSTRETANRTLVTMELQADCYAGLWLHAWGQNGLTPVTPQLLAAALSAIAADSKKRAHADAPDVLVPDPMDAGTAAQRLHWTQRGLESGNFEDCDTFGAASKGEL